MSGYRILIVKQTDDTGFLAHRLDPDRTVWCNLHSMHFTGASTSTKAKEPGIRGVIVSLLLRNPSIVPLRKQIGSVLDETSYRVSIMRIVAPAIGRNSPNRSTSSSSKRPIENISGPHKSDHFLPISRHIIYVKQIPGNCQRFERDFIYHHGRWVSRNDRASLLSLLDSRLA